MASWLIPLALWVAILGFGLLIGGAVYEHFVITPLWAADPPRSVRTWNREVGREIERARFWKPGTAPLLLATPLLLAAAGLAAAPARAWCAASAVCAALVIGSTVGYFVPVQKRTIDARGEGASDEAILRDVAGWILWNRLRFVALLAGWATAIQGLVAQG